MMVYDKLSNLDARNLRVFRMKKNLECGMNYCMIKTGRTNTCFLLPIFISRRKKIKLHLKQGEVSQSGSQSHLT